MKQSKRSDLMTSAFDDFWSSGKSPLGPKINTPKPKSFEDDAFDSFWGRNAYKPIPQQVISRPQVNYQNPQRQPVSNYRPQVNQGLSQQQQYNIIRQRLKAQQQLQKMQYKQNMIAKSKANKAIGGILSSILKTGAKTVNERIVPKIKEKVQETETYQKADIKRAKEKMWKQYKKEKREEVKKAELAAYKEKLYGPKKDANIKK